MPDLRSLTLKQLRAMAGTVRQGSVTGAAKDLHVTPPAITTQLKALEKNVGAALFDRTAEGFMPTEIGDELLKAAEDIEKRIELMRERIAALKAGASGSVVLGVVSTGKYIAPGIVAAFQEAHPGIRIKLVIGNREEIINGLEHDEFDCAIMGRPPPHIGVISKVLSDHPHVLIAAPGHRLAGDHDILVEDLLEERFLAREPGSGTRLLMERFLERIGHGRIFEIVEMGTNETIKQAVMAQLGIAFISAHTCHTELQEGRLVALSVLGLPVMRQWSLTRRSDREPTKAAAVFEQFLLSNSADLFPRLK